MKSKRNCGHCWKAKGNFNCNPFKCIEHNYSDFEEEPPQTGALSIIGIFENFIKNFKEKYE